MTPQAHQTGILRLITRLNIGGPARQALLLSKPSSLKGFNSMLAAGIPPSHEGELSDPSVDIVRLPLVREVSPIMDLRALVRVRSLMRSRRPSIVHTHMAKAGLVGRVAAASIRPRPKTVHTFHGHVLDGYFSRPVQRTFISFERSLAKRTDVLIAVSDEIRDELLGLGIGRPDQWHVIALGFDLGDLLQVEVARGTLRARIGVSADAPLVGALGRLAPIKAYDMLIRAVARLPDVHLALLGDGPLKPELEALAISLGVSERVHLPGWWTNVPAAMSDLDVVALSSLNEGTPVSLIEAAAAARPVVATRVGGVSSVVVDGVTGYLVPPNDPAALAQSMGELLRDPALRRRMGAAARSRAVTLYDKDRLVADIQDLYLGLLRGGKRGLD